MSANQSSDNKYRGWCFTINNWNADDEAILATLGNKPSTVWLIYGKEIGESGTPHLQGYVYFRHQVRLSSLKKAHKTAHWEPAHGSHAAQALYCKKGNQPKSEWLSDREEGPNYGLNADVTEFGEMPAKPHEKGGEATKVKWDTTKLLAKEGKLEQIDSEIYIKYYNTLKKIHVDNLRNHASIDARCGIWIYGKPMIGKSRWAREKYLDTEGKLYWKAINKWWDGYAGQPYVLLEDITPNIKNLAGIGYYLKIWADRYAFNGETKGSTINIRPERIIVTANYTIDEMFAGLNDSELLLAIKSRFYFIDFNTLYNVRTIPSMLQTNTFSNGTGLNYMYDDYDFEVINNSLPEREKEIGLKRSLPVQSLELSTSDNISVCSSLSDDDYETLVSSSTYHRHKQLDANDASVVSNQHGNKENLGMKLKQNPTSVKMMMVTDDMMKNMENGMNSTVPHLQRPMRNTMNGYRALASIMNKYSSMLEESEVESLCSAPAQSVGLTSTLQKTVLSSQDGTPCATPQSDDEGESVGNDMEERSDVGEYDLEDDFIASEDEFLNTNVKKRRITNPDDPWDDCVGECNPPCWNCGFVYGRGDEYIKDIGWKPPKISKKIVINLDDEDN